jgi:hypothetical protein
VKFFLTGRAVAYYRTGAINTAKRLVAELNARYPLDTWRQASPNDPDSETDRQRIRSYQDALKAAGNVDHLDPDADFGVPADDVLHQDFEYRVPTTAPGVTTISTEQLASMLEHDKPLVIDTMKSSWYRSVPGAVGLAFGGVTGGTFTDSVQERLAQKLRELTGGDTAKPIVASMSRVSTATTSRCASATPATPTSIGTAAAVRRGRWPATPKTRCGRPTGDLISPVPGRRSSASVIPSPARFVLFTQAVEHRLLPALVKHLCVSLDGARPA